MDEEEKEAFYLLDNDKELITGSFFESFRTSVADEYTKAFKTLLNLIEKQQKEIERLNQEIKDITSIPEGDEKYD